MMGGMTPREAKVVSALLENNKTGCLGNCIADNWNQRCMTCKRTYTQIKEAYAKLGRNKTASD
jgi:hypothetical protein